MIAKFRVAVKENAGPAAESILASGPFGKYRTLSVLWLTVLYLSGIAGFGHFFQWGNFDMMYMDWSNITGPRLQFFRSAVLQGEFPLHISDNATLQSATNRYLAVPDTFISPQFLLLYKLPLPIFSMVDVWLLYSAGFGGLLALRRKLRLSLVSFTVLFLLFNFNGSILGHLSAGHLTWGGYFLFSWYVWLVLRLVEGDRSWTWTALMAVLLLIIWLQGSFHQYVYLLIMLAAVAIFIPAAFWTVIRTGLVTFVVSAFRILPGILAYTNYKQTFINGYPSLISIWDNLVSLPGSAVNSANNYAGLGDFPGGWEMTAFVGLVGGLFLVYFGVYCGLLKRQSPYRALLAPLGVILLLTLGQVFDLFRQLPIPLIQGERVSSRLFEVVLAFGLVLAAERFQRWLDEGPQKPVALAGALLGLGLIGFDLWQDLTYWSVANRPLVYWNFFNPANWTVKNDYADTRYLWAVFGGLAVSIVAIVILGGLSWREHRALHPPIKKALIVLLFTLAGWGMLAAVLLIGRKLLGMPNALIAQAVAAPVVFALVSWLYFRRYAYTSPLRTACIFTGAAIFLQAAVFAFFTPQGATIFFRPLSAWAAFALTFATTYLVGKI